MGVDLRPAAFDDFRFLVGRWEGEGRLRGAPVTAMTLCREASPDALELWTEVRRQGVIVCEYRVVFDRAEDGLAGCTTDYADDSGIQRWDVEAVPSWNGWLLTRTGQRWELRRTGDGFEETFGPVAADGSARPVVVLRHGRAADARP